jgi:hypothetical protein
VPDEREKNDVFCKATAWDCQQEDEAVANFEGSF